MKINLQKVANGAIRIAGPVVLAAIAHKLATGKLDLKGILLDAASKALADRPDVA